MNKALYIVLPLLCTVLFLYGKNHGVQHMVSIPEKEAGNHTKDSLQPDPVLADALKIAYKHIGRNTFYKRYKVTPEGDTEITVTISIGHPFTKESVHLIIRRESVVDVSVDIYAKSGGKFKPVAAHGEGKLTYMNDTIRDINGDGMKDFVVSWYGASGCCLKAFSEVYVLRADKMAFTEGMQFTNPTFSPDEKVVRGVCYGYAGMTDLYKYKWNGAATEEVEYVSYERDSEGERTGKILVTEQRNDAGDAKMIRRIDAVPVEYTNIYGYDWFTGEGIIGE